MFVPIERLRFFGLQISYSKHPMLAYRYHWMINIYKQEIEGLPKIMLSYLFLLESSFMVVYNEVFVNIKC